VLVILGQDQLGRSPTSMQVAAPAGQFSLELQQVQNQLEVGLKQKFFKISILV
jgi:hypothetical protein